MSRKKINIYIITGILACFLVCLFGSYHLAKEYVAKDFENTIDNLTVDFEKKYGMEDNFGTGYSYFKTTPEALMGEFSKEADHTYPWQAVFTTDSREIVARSGSWMYFYDRYFHANINFDEYLSDEHWEILDDFWSKIEYPIYIDNPKSREYVGYGLDYNKSDGEIIPVKLTLVELERSENMATLQFSDEKAYHHFSGNMLDFESKDAKEWTRLGEYYIPIADESISNKSAGYMRAHFTDVDKHGRCRAIYQSLAERLNEENIQNDYVYKLTQNQKYCWGNTYLYEGYLQINGKYYIMYLLAEYSEFDEVIRSEVFLNAIKVQSMLLISLGVIILLVANYLYKKNQKLEVSRQMFTSAVAHELKTPVAIIQNQCECILEDIAPKKNKEYVKSVYDEATVMNRMIMAFLQYNRLQTVTQIEREKCNLRDIVENEIQKYEDLIEEAGLVLEVELEDKVNAVVNKELLTVVVGNYLSNAYKYTETGRCVKVLLRWDNKKAYFEVFNEGGYIDPKYKEAIWDVLGRQDEARNRKTGSSGMGLPICQKILELHGFEYGYENVENGVKFWFRG